MVAIKVTVWYWLVIKFPEITKDTPLHFHNLRVTFGVITYFQTRDIYKVSQLMKYKDLNITKEYANFSISRIEADFPKLAKRYIN